MGDAKTTVYKKVTETVGANNFKSPFVISIHHPYWWLVPGRP